MEIIKMLLPRTSWSKHRGAREKTYVDGMGYSRTGMIGSMYCYFAGDVASRKCSAIVDQVYLYRNSFELTAGYPNMKTPISAMLVVYLCTTRLAICSMLQRWRE